MKMIGTVGCLLSLWSSCLLADAQLDKLRSKYVHTEELIQNVTRARASIHPTQGNAVTGVVTFTVVPEGVKIVADIQGLTPGLHGFHIHEKGDCSAPDASSAGGHYNPRATRHGGPESPERHVGDLGNLIADPSGVAHYERVDEVISLNGPESIIGRSVVIHSKADDFQTQPAGDSGDRQGCGKIIIVK